MASTTKTSVFMSTMLEAKFKGTSRTTTSMRIGIGTTAPTIADTTMTKGLPVNSTELIDGFDATTGWVAGTDSAVALNNSTFIEGTGSVSLAKSGTAGTVMSMDKTVASLDWTNKDFWVWVNLVDVTDLVASGTALVIRYGSSSGDYYQFDIDVANLATGRNDIKLVVADADSTVGTPDDSNMDYLYFAFNTDLSADTIAANRVLVDNAHLASSGDYVLALNSGYPVVNTTELFAESRGTLNTTDANGYLISEFGEINVDGNLDSHAVIDGDSKSDTDIFVLSEITKVRLQSV